MMYCYLMTGVLLACLIHAASVRSEPESNSPFYSYFRFFKTLLLEYGFCSTTYEPPHPFPFRKNFGRSISASFRNRFEGSICLSHDSTFKDQQRFAKALFRISNAKQPITDPFSLSVPGCRPCQSSALSNTHRVSNISQST